MSSTFVQAAHKDLEFLGGLEQPGKLDASSCVRQWVLEMLTQHCLGKHLLKIYRSRALLETWYSRQALTQSPELHKSIWQASLIYKNYDHLFCILPAEVPYTQFTA